MMAQLMPCSCGGTTLCTIKKKSNHKRIIDGVRHDLYTAYVLCQNCRHKGPAASVYVNGWMANPTALMEQKAAEKWNEAMEIESV